MSSTERACPGCGLSMPLRAGARNSSYYNASPECWLVYTEVLAAEYENAVLFGQVHQLTVDSYAVQHAGGDHPDKSVGIHLCGLHLVLERGCRPTSVPPLLQELAVKVPEWPHFQPPRIDGGLTVMDVGLSASLEEHVDSVRAWAAEVWRAWSDVHGEVAALVNRNLDLR